MSLSILLPVLWNGWDSEMWPHAFALASTRHFWAPCAWLDLSVALRGCREQSGAHLLQGGRKGARIIDAFSTRKNVVSAGEAGWHSVSRIQRRKNTSAPGDYISV